MMWWGHGWWWAGAALMVFCMLMMTRMMGHGRSRHGGHGTPGHREHDVPERKLAERLASGEIDIEEFQRLRETLSLGAKVS